MSHAPKNTRLYCCHTNSVIINKQKGIDKESLYFYLVLFKDKNTTFCLRIMEFGGGNIIRSFGGKVNMEKYVSETDTLRNQISYFKVTPSVTHINIINNE